MYRTRHLNLCMTVPCGLESCAATASGSISPSCLRALVSHAHSSSLLPILHLHCIWKKKWGKPGRNHHVTDMSGFREGALNTVECSCLQHLETLLAMKRSNLANWMKNWLRTRVTRSHLVKWLNVIGYSLFRFWTTNIYIYTNISLTWTKLKCMVLVMHWIMTTSSKRHTWFRNSKAWAVMLDSTTKGPLLCSIGS